MPTLNDLIRDELKRAKDRLRSLVPPDKHRTIEARMVSEVRHRELERQIESLERIKQRAEGTL